MNLPKHRDTRISFPNSYPIDVTLPDGHLQKALLIFRRFSTHFSSNEVGECCNNCIIKY